MRPSSAWLQDRMRKVRAYDRYVRPESVLDVSLDVGLASDQIVKLNQNENLFLPRELLTSLLREVVEEVDVRLYYKEAEDELKEALSKYVGVFSDRIILGPGSDQIIDLVARTFLRRGEGAVAISPTFSMFKWAISHLGANIQEVRLREDFSLSVEDILRASKEGGRMAFVCSPNNPTGNQFDVEDVERLIDGFPGLVLMDEAYAEFADMSLARFVDKYDNLIVTRTFSKAFGLAGARLGYALSNPEMADLISQYAQLPYSTSILSLRLALKALNKIDAFMEGVKRLKEERKRLIEALKAIRGVRTFDSDANFVLFSTERPYEEVFQGLYRRGILVRRIGRVLKFDGCLRATVGLPSMNDRLIKALSSLCGGV